MMVMYAEVGMPVRIPAVSYEYDTRASLPCRL